MSDLRTRIAAAITDYLNLGPDGLAFVDATALADAVIRELKFEREDGECSYCHAQLPGCRYICDWTTDD